MRIMPHQDSAEMSPENPASPKEGMINQTLKDSNATGTIGPLTDGNTPTNEGSADKLQGLKTHLLNNKIG